MRNLLVAAAFALGACAFPPPTIRVAGPAPVELPFRVAAEGLVLVNGRVNGLQDVDFVLDTGAPVTVLIDNARTRALRLDTRSARRLGDDPASPTGVISAGHSIELGRVSITELTAVLIPGASMPCAERVEALGFGGVIGADLFRRFVVEVDWKAGVLRLHEPRAWRPDPRMVPVPIVFEQGHPYVDATIRLADGRRVPARLHLDTGMNLPLSLPTGEGAAFTAPEGGRPRPTCFVSARHPAVEGEPVGVEMGDVRIEGVTPIYAPRAGASSTRQGGALGGGALRHRPLAIDYAGRRIFIGAP